MLSSSYYKAVQKVFVKGFYKAHSGALFFLFTVLLFYFFFIGILDKMPDEKKLSWNLIFARLTLNDWWMVGLFSVITLLYILKSWHYILTEIGKEKNVIVQQAGQCFRVGKLFSIWIRIQCKIMLPLFVYSLFIGMVGLMFTFKAVFLLVWLLFWLLISTFFYIKIIRFPADYFLKWQFLSTPIFKKRKLHSLYLWYVADKLKVLFILTKLSSWVLILGSFLSTDFGDNSTIYNYFVASVIALTNSLVVFKEYQFNVRYLYWSFNFPKQQWTYFFNSLWSYGLLLLPEVLWMFSYFGLWGGLKLFVWVMSILLLYKSVLSQIGVNMKLYLKAVFGIFVLLYFVSLYNLSLFAVPWIVGFSYFLFRKNFPLKQMSG
ncbi:MAG: hypothetical protein DI598_10395 [Pseudopedobacter saltans]|uniref:Uncharacterized protein n=1 Tax=Pseudopedobacter saltans TaxID=151895 RepID=A0A2W5H2C3_9SPHI|nr:MAG: hypothetical protein DI598_10395 [Pseudopedobacter saltans]